MKSNKGGLAFSDIKLYYKVAIIKGCWKDSDRLTGKTTEFRNRPKICMWMLNRWQRWHLKLSGKHRVSQTAVRTTGKR